MPSPTPRELSTELSTQSRDKALLVGGWHLPGCATSRVCRRFSTVRAVRIGSHRAGTAGRRRGAAGGGFRGG
eukprot:2305718-Pyramimonas_sp.AAC.1